MANIIAVRPKRGLCENLSITELTIPKPGSIKI